MTPMRTFPALRNQHCSYMNILDWREKVNWLRALPLYVAGSAVILLPPATEATESFTGSRGPEEMPSQESLARRNR